MMSTPRSGPETRLTPSATMRRASMSSPESVSSRTASFGRSIASWRISIRFFSPPEKPSFRYRLENSFGISASSIACSVSWRNSRSFTSGSPRASRWALSAMRRYLATVTPGIATGYWKAMKSPARARSSGAASVMSSPSKRISPAVTSNAGWPMIAFASVDLPDPFGPISAWTSPAGTRRSIPRRISLPSAVTSRPLTSSSGTSRLHGRRELVPARELDELGECGLRQRLRHPAVHPRPEQLRGAGSLIELVRAEDPPLADGLEALHRRDRPLQRLDDLEHRDLARCGRSATPSVGAANRAHEMGVAKLRHEVLEVGERQRFGLRQGGQRDRLGLEGPLRSCLPAELDHQPHAVLRLRREEHRIEILATGSVLGPARRYGSISPRRIA